MPPKLIHSALVEIAGLLDAAGVEYYIGGSAMLSLEGFDVPVGDIDLVVAAESRPLIELIFIEHQVRQSKLPWHSSWLLGATWGTGDEAIAIDIIGDLALEIDGVIAQFPIAGLETVSVGDTEIKLGPLRHWYHLYRVHSPEKAKMIAGWLTDEEIMTGAAELGISDSFSPTLIVRMGNESAVNPIEVDMSTEQQSSIIEVASPTDVSFDAPGSETIDLDLLNETLEYIRPALQADGGDLILLGTEGGKVTLQMVGACGGCPLSTMTLTAGIERILQDRVPGVPEVVSV